MEHRQQTPLTDREVALLGLAASERGEPDACPGDDELAAFIDGRLGGSSRDAMLAHLDACPTCYREWLAASRAATPKLRDRLGDAGACLLAGLRRIGVERRPIALAIPATAVAAVVAVLVWPSAPVGETIDAAYEVVAAGDADLASVLRRLPLPGEGAELAFSPAPPHLRARAFRAGLADGRASLLGEASGQSTRREDLAAPDGGAWRDSEWASFYELGRWELLLLARLRAGLGVESLERHREIARRLGARLNARQDDPGAARIAAGLSAIAARLDGLADDPGPASLAELDRRLLAAIHLAGS